MNQTDRSDFNDTWLSEMPSGIGNFETYDYLLYNILDAIKNGFNVVPLSNGLMKASYGSTIYYWFGNVNTVILGSELKIKPQGLVVAITGKDPKYKGVRPFASELYNMILSDSNRSVRLLSDTQLSDEGYNLWKTMLKQGHAVSVYDSKTPGKTLTTFTSEKEMDDFFKHDDTAYERYQFVLSESTGMLGEMRSHFNTRRFRELSGLSLSDKR